MKGALIKELYLSRHHYTVFGIVYAALFVLGCLTTAFFAAVPLLISLFYIGRYVSEDELCGWSDYSKALPHTPLKSMTAKYIVAFSEMLLLCLISFAIYLFNSYLSRWELLWFLLSDFMVSSVAVSVVLPLNFSGNKHLKSFAVVLQVLLCVVLGEIHILNNASLFSVLCSAMYLEKWLVPVTVFSGLLVMLISILFSTLLLNEGYSISRIKLKRTLYIALSCLFVLSAVSVAFPAINSRFTPQDIWVTGIGELNGKYILENNKNNNRNRINENDLKQISQAALEESLYDKSLDEIIEFFTDLGMKHYGERTDLWETSSAHFQTVFGGIQADVYCKGFLSLKSDGYDADKGFTEDEYKEFYKVTVSVNSDTICLTSAEFDSYVEWGKTLVGISEKELIEQLCAKGFGGYSFSEIPEGDSLEELNVERQYNIYFMVTETQGVKDIDFTVRNGKVVDCSYY